MSENIAKNLTQGYWDKLLGENTSLKGVGWPNWPESYNLILYKKYLKSFEDVINDLKQNHSFNLDNTISVFEVGPGTGFYTNYFWQSGVKHYIGADISEVSIEKLKSKYPIYNFERKDISQPDEFVMKNEGKFDLICIVDVLLHITDDNRFRNAIANLGKMLKPGGFMIVGDNITIYRKISYSEGSKYTHDTSRHIDYVKDLFANFDLELKNIYHRKNYFLNKNFDFHYSIFELFSKMFFFFLNGGLSVFRNNNLVGKMVGYPLSIFDTIVTPFQKYSKNGKFLLFRKTK
jgi:SAM-dependent methyltransferase